MADHDWIKEFPAAVTVSDADGILIAMNDKAVQIFDEDGGAALLGTNVLDCHPEPARTKLREIMTTRRPNVYTIEKSGIKKLIYQAPWNRDGRFAGVVELSLEIPFDMPHFARKG